MGGITTKIHAVVEGLGRCIDFTLTKGAVHDCTQMESLLRGKEPQNVLADRAYDTDEIRRLIKTIGANAVIPSQGRRIEAIPYDEHTYGERRLVENFFQYIKRFRRVGTRYEKKALYYESIVTLACIIQWLVF